MIIYGVITETSIGELLIAGILPGILYFGVFSLAIVLFAYLRPSSAPAEKDVDTSWKTRFASIKKVWGVVVMFGVVIGGIYGGLVTPTEAAALGAAGALLLTWLNRRLTWTVFKDAIIETVEASAMIFLLLGGASIFTLFMSASGVISSATQGLIDLNLSPTLLMFTLLLLYIVLGMFLDSISMMILTMPLVLPILQAQGMSIILFGVIMCMIVEIGCITPPMGLNVYVMKGALGRSVDLNDIFLGALPFVILQIFIVIVLYYFPMIALWLPGMMIH
jgi:C4-dicarboxylate transporter DctM subunit